MQAHKDNTPKAKEPQILPPHDFEAEQAVLGAMLISDGHKPSEAIPAVRGILSPSDFYREAHKYIATAIYSLFERGEPTDVLSVAEELKRMGKLEEVGGISYLQELVDVTPTNAPQYAAYHAKRVKDLAIKRSLIARAEEIKQRLFDDGTEAEEAIQLFAVTAEEFARMPPDRRLISAKELLEMDLPEPRWIIPGLLPEGLTLLAGRPKTGKSMLVLDIALAVATGGKALGSLPVEEGGEVVYIALEEGLKRLGQRLKALLGDDGEKPETLLFADKWPPLERGGLAELERLFLARPQIKLVVIDPVGRLRYPPKPGSDVYALDVQILGKLQTLAQRYGKAILAVHHTRKAPAPESDPFLALLGSTGWTGSADIIWLLRRPRKERRAELLIAGRDIEDKGYALEWDDLLSRWLLLGDADEFFATEEQRKIIEYLQEAGEPCSPKEIAEGLGKSVGAVKNLLARLVEAGKVERVGRGKYRAKAPEATSPGATQSDQCDLCDFRDFVTLESHKVTKVTSKGCDFPGAGKSDGKRISDESHKVTKVTQTPTDLPGESPIYTPSGVPIVLQYTEEGIPIVTGDEYLWEAIEQFARERGTTFDDLGVMIRYDKADPRIIYYEFPLADDFYLWLYHRHEG